MTKKLVRVCHKTVSAKPVTLAIQGCSDFLAGEFFYWSQWQSRCRSDGGKQADTRSGYFSQLWSLGSVPDNSQLRPEDSQWKCFLHGGRCLV